MGVTLFALKALFAITPIGAARDIDGFIALCLSGAVAGYVFRRSKRAGKLAARLIFQPTRMQKRLGIAARLFAPFENQIASRGKGD